jgi:hypothetical protein
MNFSVTIWIDNLLDAAEYYSNHRWYRQIITSWDEEKEKYRVEIYG